LSLEDCVSLSDFKEAVDSYLKELITSIDYQLYAPLKSFINASEGTLILHQTLLRFAVLICV
jgi:hypothetical protein